MKLFLAIFLSFSLSYAVSIDKKIKQNKKQLQSKKNEYKKMDKRLSAIATKILKAKKEQKKLASKLTVLEKNIKNNKASFERLQKKEKTLSGSLGGISSKIDLKETKFLDLVSKNFSLALALEELKQPTKDSVMMKEVYKVYARKNSEEINLLKTEIVKLKGKKSKLSVAKLQIEKEVKAYKKEQSEYKSKKEKQDKLVKELARDKALYKKRFDRIKKSRRNFEKKLAKLKIIKRKSIKDAKAKALASKKAKKKRKKKKKGNSRKKKEAVISNPDVIQYKGGKTISPIKGSRLIKKFGTYIDPIYKFKIFNKSVTLKAPYAGAKVRSILRGTVVFAENSGGMLGQIVIVEHADNMHTIYAKLSRLAPGIRVGKKLSKGTTIGKVEKSLMFEVTKNNKHINPMKLIQL